MKNITLSADERLIEQAREKAREEKTSLNALFRVWLRELAEEGDRTDKIAGLFDRLGNVDSGGTFSREQMNER